MNKMLNVEIRNIFSGMHCCQVFDKDCLPRKMTCITVDKKVLVMVLFNANRTDHWAHTLKLIIVRYSQT